MMRLHRSNVPLAMRAMVQHRIHRGKLVNLSTWYVVCLMVPFANRNARARDLQFSNLFGEAKGGQQSLSYPYLVV